MRTLVVGYDLQRPGQHYGRLEAKLKSFPSWWHNLDSTWLVRTPLTAAQVRDQLIELVDSNDKLLVVEIAIGRWAANLGFTRDALNWLAGQA